MSAFSPVPFFELRTHPVCIPCHHHGRLYCVVRGLMWRLRVLDVWYWVTDAAMPDGEAPPSFARAFRTRRVVPRPEAWDRDEETFQRLYNARNATWKAMNTPSEDRDWLR